MPHDPRDSRSARDQVSSMSFRDETEVVSAIRELSNKLDELRSELHTNLHGDLQNPGIITQLSSIRLSLVADANTRIKTIENYIEEHKKKMEARNAAMWSMAGTCGASLITTIVIAAWAVMHASPK